MTLRLSDFEQQIDPTILRRGYEYFIIGSVTDVDDLGDGEYEATVEGSDIYNVSLHIEGDEVTEYDCDCPYDWGPVCKHVVAVLFHLRKELQETPRKQTRSKPKKESEAAQFERLLKQTLCAPQIPFLQKDKSQKTISIGNMKTRGFIFCLLDNISQNGTPVMLCGCALPEQFECCDHRRYFSDIYYLAVVCDDEILEKRLRMRPAWRGCDSEEYIRSAVDFNRYIKKNAETLKPAMTLLDNSHLTLKEETEFVREWIIKKTEKSENAV